jgi:hypothetical protein
VPTERGLSLFAVLERADPALVDPGVTAQMERLLDQVLIGRQEMVAAVDAVCAQASRIIGRERGERQGEPSRKAAARERQASTGKPRAKQPGKAVMELRSANAPNGDTPLRIPFGNKEAALQLGARYRAGGWYAPAGVDLSGFRERGWL